VWWEGDLNMKLIKGSITRLSSQGYITLQIPGYAIGDPGIEIETEEVPDNWIIILHSNKCASVGKEGGFLFLTKTGWEANKDKIKDAYENAKHQRGPWEKFELHAEEQFKKVEKSTKHKIQFLQKKIDQLKSVYLTLI